MKPAFRPASLPLVAAALMLAACQQPEPDGPQAPDAKPGLAVNDGVLVLPVVAGRPGAAYFEVANSGKDTAMLAAVTIEGAEKAEMHETIGGGMAPLTQVEIRPGESVRLARGGKHVMVFGLDATAKPGGTTEMTLTFAGGDKLSAPLRVESMGSAEAEPAS